MNFRFLICVGLSLIGADALAQKTKTVVVYDSPDHSEWHTEKVEEYHYAPYEFCYDLNNVDTTWNADVRRFNDSLSHLKPEQRIQYLNELEEKFRRYQDSLKATYKKED